SAEGRKLFTDMVADVASQVFIPLTVGGGIESVSDFERVLTHGADKVSVNSGALKNPSLIDEAAHRYGDQCVVLSIDCKRVGDEFHIFSKGGRVDTGRTLYAWAKEGVERGAGEIVLNSIDTDGVKQGFDLEMLRVLADLKVPVIASGGAGSMQDFSVLFKTLPWVSAGLAASIFHYKEVDIHELKQVLKDAGVQVRLTKGVIRHDGY
ncbi:MAG: imidazole glycerol phosphate synthase subunit HisF, partial [Firmicutes bacterium]|nr:imidazole glycerol phosphate synthase subunit HisF [Bacillota bacterium]